MPNPPEPSGPASGSVVSDVTCTACGCLCDDIALVVAGGRIIEARHACEPGRMWFLADRGQGGRPSATIEGRAVDPGEALDRAAEILGRARCPIVAGLTVTTTEAQAEAVALADRIGAVVDAGRAADATPRIAAIQRIGSVSASLGEVKNRADLVVFWGVDPIASHPRHWERYSVEPVGRFVPAGRAGRTVLVADAERTATAERADDYLRVAPESQFAVLWTLRALVAGLDLDPGRVERATGTRLDDLRGWAGRMAGARYGAFFFGSGLGRSQGGSASVEAALALVRDLNARTRFVALTLGGPGNAAGAQAVLTWQAGFPIGVDFRRGYPRSLPDEATAAALLAGAQADAVLIVADDPTPDWPPAARDHLARIPSVVIAPDATAPGRTATVALASATYGIHAPGTVVRSDGVHLPLRPALTSDLPTDRELLSAIGDRLRS